MQHSSNYLTRLILKENYLQGRIKAISNLQTCQSSKRSRISQGHTTGLWKMREIIFPLFNMSEASLWHNTTHETFHAFPAYPYSDKTYMFEKTHIRNLGLVTGQKRWLPLLTRANFSLKMINGQGKNFEDTENYLIIAVM